MPRFFFHVFDDIVVRDDEGIDLPDTDAARSAALAGARALLCDQVLRGEIHLNHRIEVEDVSGERVLVLPFAEAVRIDR